MRTGRLVVMSLLLAGTAYADLSMTPKVAATQAALRDLWVGHIFWARNVAMATMTNQKDVAAASEAEVVANAKQIAGALEPYYGKPASDKMFTLLAGHWGAVKAHLVATSKGDLKGQEAATKQATTNAEEIATFLSGANPYLTKDALNGLLVTHYGHHVSQNTQLKAKKYADEARTWDAMRLHIYGLADALGDAIGKQFPEKFR